jgi:hypothetical protein
MLLILIWMGKEAFRTLLCGHLIPDLAGIALDS